MNKELVKGLAEKGEGQAEFIDDELNEIDEKGKPTKFPWNFSYLVLRQLRRALKPALTDIKFTWPGNVPQTPFLPHILQKYLINSFIFFFNFTYHLYLEMEEWIYMLFMLKK